MKDNLPTTTLQGQVAKTFVAWQNSRGVLAALGAAALLWSMPNSAQAVASINVTAFEQSIDGFGASTAWAGQITNTQADLLWSNGWGDIGLSLMRVRIDPNGSFTDEAANAAKCHARQGRVLGTPWTSPAWMKSNNNTIGGSLNSGNFGNYASYLAGACNSLGLDWCSIQNEPDFLPGTYESCSWTPSQLETFCDNNAQNIGRAVVTPESFSFNDSYSDPTLNDGLAASHVSIIAGHLYGNGLYHHTNALNHGKHVWMTEHYYNGSDIGTCMNIAKEVNDCMANNFSAYIWWTATWGTCNLINGTALLKNAYILAQYAKYVRPGMTRVDADYNPSSNIYETAYVGSGHTTVVVINTGGSGVTQQFHFWNGGPSTLIPFQTTASTNIQQLGNITVSSGAWSAYLPPQSVTTFYN